jgi:hypothetical protein
MTAVAVVLCLPLIRAIWQRGRPLAMSVSSGWSRPNQAVKGALATGTVLSMVVTGAWSVTAAATMGPVTALHLSWRHPAASYLSLAAAPAGNGLELFTVVVVIYALCLLRAAWRRAWARGTGDGQE